MKTCCMCNQTMDISNFSYNGFQPATGSRKYKPFCKSCEVKYNRNRRLTIVKKAYGKPLACEVCGYNKNFTALDFHHLNPSEKEYNVSDSISFSKVSNEISKCILLCRNCHQELHNPDCTL